MSHFRKYYSPSTLNPSSGSPTSVSTPSTVIHVGPSTPAETSSDGAQVSTDPNPLPSTHLSTTAFAFRGQGTNRGAMPTSNFLINRHKLLRKTEEGKVAREGGTLSGSRSQLTSSSSNLAQKAKEYENYGANGKLFAEDEERHASMDTLRYDDSGGNITETDFSERSEVSRIPVGNVEYGENERPIEHISSQKYESGVAPRAAPSVRWSPSSSSRPQVPPKPDISSNELERKMEEIAAKSKQSRGILRVPSLRGTLTRSRTPSRGPSEERPAKKKEEYLHESVTYTKTKAPAAEVPVNSAAPSSGRANFFRGRQGNTASSSSSSRAEVSSPQLLNTTTDQVGSAVEIGGTSRRISPSPQRTSIIPAPVQTVQTVNLPLRETDRPVDLDTVVQNAPVYSRLSDVRSAPKQTTRIQQMMESSRPAVPSPTPSGFIQPQIRPIPPRKPIRSDMTETLTEVVPQQKAKRPAPTVPPINHRAATGGRSEQHVTTIRTSSPSPTRAGHLSTVANLGHTSPTRGATVTVNNHNNVGHDAARPIHRIESAPKSVNDSLAGQMTFDDEFDSLMSSSHVDYEHSSADEEDALVRRSLMKPAGNRRGNIDDIKEENITTTYVDNAPTVYKTEVAAHSQSHYDKLPQRPTRTVVQRKPSFLSSADDSDSSRGQGNLAAPHVRSSVTTTRVSRRESDVNQADQQLPRDDSAGRRKYDERRQLLRSFEDNLQRKRHQSAKDSDLRDDRFTQSNLNGPRNPQQPNHIYRKTGQIVSQSTSRYPERDSDDDFTDSVGIPEPLPEYEYPSRVQGRTIQEVQEIRESVRLREPSTTSSEDHSPSRKAQKRGHNFSRHFDITPEEYTSTRSLIHHRLPPPNYVPDSPPPPPVLGQTGSRLSLAERNRTPPPTRPIHLSRPHSQSPDNRFRPGQTQARLPPPSPVAPFVHHSDGEGRYYTDQKPKKKMNIVRRLSELVRGERKHRKPEIGRKSSTSSMEQEQENRPPVRLITARQQSPVRRYQDQPLRQTAPPPQVVSRIPSFTRPVTSNRNSGNFSDSQTASFTYQEQPIPVYAQPNKLLKQQNLRHRSMSEYDLSYNPGHSPGRNIQYVDKPLKNAKSTESVSESVWKEKVRYRYDHDPPDEKYEKVTKTTLIPWTKSKVLNRSGDEGRNTAHVRHGFFDKDLQHYRSTPALPINSNQVDMRMMPAPSKPPRRYDFDGNRGSDSDRSEPLRVPLRSSERLREHRMTPNPAPDYYSQPSETSRRTIHTSTSSGGEDSTPQPTRVPLRRVETTTSTHSSRAPRQVERTAVVRGPVEKIQIQVQPAYARTRIAANDYANRRYQTDLNRTPPEEVSRRSAVREQTGARGPSGYKAAYKMLIDNPASSAGGGMVQERRRIFNNGPQPARADYYAHRR